MEIVIKIPKEFENHFNSDKFEDSLQRARFDIHKAIIGDKDVLSGNYEIETLDMLTEAFLNGTPLSKRHGRLIDVNDLLDRIGLEDNDTNREENVGEIITLEDFDYTPTIIEADTESEGK